MYMLKKNMRIYISPCRILSWINMVIMFPSSGDIQKDIENNYDKVESFLDIFYNLEDDIRVNLDITYTVEKEICKNANKIKEALLSLNYEPKKTCENDFRKFNIEKKHNVTNTVSLRNNDKNIIANIATSIDNIIVHKEKLNEEMLCSSYFYATEYTKIHSNIIKALDSDFYNANHEFYESIK